MHTKFICKDAHRCQECRRREKNLFSPHNIFSFANSILPQVTRLRLFLPTAAITAAEATPSPDRGPDSPPWPRSTPTDLTSSRWRPVRNKGGLLPGQGRALHSSRCLRLPPAPTTPRRAGGHRRSSDLTRPTSRRDPGSPCQMPLPSGLPRSSSLTKVSLDRCRRTLRGSLRFSVPKREQKKTGTTTISTISSSSTVF